jgi:hypothetical protein
MSYVNFDSLTPAAAQDLPTTLDQRMSLTATISLGLLLFPAIAALLVPAGLGLWLLINDADVAHLHGEEPVGLMQLALLPVLAGALCWLPTRALALRLFRRRQVVIGDGQIKVTERWLTGRRSWQAPISDYRGLAHNMRTSMSGTRHELVLVHEQPKRSVLLHVADRVPQALIDRYAATLGVSEVTSRELHRLDPSTAGWLPQFRGLSAARA